MCIYIYIYIYNISDTSINVAYSGIFFFGGVHKRRHYRYPIVAFSKNVAIGLFVAVF